MEKVLNIIMDSQNCMSKDVKIISEKVIRIDERQINIENKLDLNDEVHKLLDEKITDASKKVDTAIIERKVIKNLFTFLAVILSIISLIFTISLNYHKITQITKAIANKDKVIKLNSLNDIKIDKKINKENSMNTLLPSANDAD